jgi:hypothetical protein
MYHVYSRDAFGGITERFAGETRWQCEKWLREMRRAGKPTHFYVVSKLKYWRALKRYSSEHLT